MRHFLPLLLLLSPLAWGQFSWIPLNKRMPTGYEEASYTNMVNDSANRRAIIIHRIVDGDQPGSIYSNAVIACSLKVITEPLSSDDSVICYTLDHWEWTNVGGGSDQHVMLAGNLVGDSTPPPRHPYIAVKEDTLVLFGGVHGRGGIRDTISFDAGGVDVSTETITLNRGLKWFSNRDAIVFAASPPGGLTAGTTYFMIRVSDTEIRVATTSANAAAGTAINLTSQSASSFFHAFSPEFPPSDLWVKKLTGDGDWTMRHPSPSYARGTSLFGQANVWWPPKNAFLIQHLRNYEATEEYAFKYSMGSNAFTELTSGGNARVANEAPMTSGGQTMAYNDVDSCVYYFGDADTSISFEPFGNDLYRMCADEVWERLTVSDPKPMRRDNHAFIKISGTDKFVIVGGNTRVPGSNTLLRDSWIYDRSDNAYDSVEVGTLPTGSAHAYATYMRGQGGILYQSVSSGSTFYFADIGEDPAPAGGVGKKSLLGVGK